MISVIFFKDSEKVGSKSFSLNPTAKNKAQITAWVHEGKIKPDNNGFTHFELSWN